MVLLGQPSTLAPSIAENYMSGISKISDPDMIKSITI